MGIHYKITFSTCPDMMQLTTFQTTVSRRMIFTVLLAVDPANPPPHRTLQTHSQCQARQGVMLEMVMVMVIVSRRISIAFISPRSGTARSLQAAEDFAAAHRL